MERSMLGIFFLLAHPKQVKSGSEQIEELEYRELVGHIA